MVDSDSKALEVAKVLSNEANTKYEFVECDTSEDVERFSSDLIILDVAFGIQKVEIVTDLDKIEQTKPYSMHDFDLGLTLKLLKKLGKIKSVKIIAIPMDYDTTKAVEEVRKIVANL